MLNDCPHYDIHDDYYTPDAVWDMIQPYVPTGVRIYEPCMLNATLSTSPDYWKNKGHEVIYDTNHDFLNDEDVDKDLYDIIITNPPFDKTKKIPILKKLISLDKPFLIIMNGMNIHTKYFYDIFKDKQEDLEIIHPKTKLYFHKNVNGELITKKNTAFYSVFVSYKMGLGITLL